MKKNHQKNIICGVNPRPWSIGAIVKNLAKEEIKPNATKNTKGNGLYFIGGFHQRKISNNCRSLYQFK